MEKTEKYKLESLWRQWEGLAQRMERHIATERWEDTRKELQAVVRTYRRTAAQLKALVNTIEVEHFLRQKEVKNVGKMDKL